jgi:hypothetical protein
MNGLVLLAPRLPLIRFVLSPPWEDSREILLRLDMQPRSRLSNEGKKKQEIKTMTPESLKLATRGRVSESSLVYSRYTEAIRSRLAGYFLPSPDFRQACPTACFPFPLIFFPALELLSRNEHVPLQSLLGYFSYSRSASLASRREREGNRLRWR